MNFIRSPESATFENIPIHAKNIYRSSHFQTKGYSSLLIIFKLKQKGNHCKVLLNLVIWSAIRAGKPKSLRFWSISFRSVYFQYLKQTFRSGKESKQAARTLAKCFHTLAVETFLSPFSETSAVAGPWFCLRELQTGMTALLSPAPLYRADMGVVNRAACRLLTFSSDHGHFSLDQGPCPYSPPHHSPTPIP